MTKAREFFDRALALDPDNVEALAGIAQVDANLAISLSTDDKAARFAAAEAAVTKALSLAPDHALAHLCMGMILGFTNRAAQGIAEYERALALDRNLAGAHALIGQKQAVHRPGRGDRGACSGSASPQPSRPLGLRLAADSRLRGLSSRP
jgi:tetratricopeptide (TPR) repeat protein